MMKECFSLEAANMSLLKRVTSTSHMDARNLVLKSLFEMNSLSSSLR